MIFERGKERGGREGEGREEREGDKVTGGGEEGKREKFEKY